MTWNEAERMFWELFMDIELTFVVISNYAVMMESAKRLVNQVGAPKRRLGKTCIQSVQLGELGELVRRAQHCRSQGPANQHIS